MDDPRLGAAFRAVRIRRQWRQSDVAERAGVSRAFVSLVERGHLDRVSLGTLRTLGRVLEVRIDTIARWRGGELDRLLRARHSALAESVAGTFARLPGWTIVPEVSFSIWGERGVIDLLAFHRPSGCLLVIELKTDIVDVNELVGTLDRKARLAPSLVKERGWRVTSVSRWLILADDKTNQRRVAAHRAMLRAALPETGRTMRGWLRRPTGSVRALSVWTLATPRSASPLRTRRVRVRRGLPGPSTA
jgi:transcriptional regulator with XRE-family HTH domain